MPSSTLQRCKPGPPPRRERYVRHEALLPSISRQSATSCRGVPLLQISHGVRNDKRGRRGEGARDELEAGYVYSFHYEQGHEQGKGSRLTLSWLLHEGVQPLQDFTARPPLDQLPSRRQTNSVEESCRKYHQCHNQAATSLDRERRKAMTSCASAGHADDNNSLSRPRQLMFAQP